MVPFFNRSLRLDHRIVLWNEKYLKVLDPLTYLNFHQLHNIWVWFFSSSWFRIILFSHILFHLHMKTGHCFGMHFSKYSIFVLRGLLWVLVCNLKHNGKKLMGTYGLLEILFSSSFQLNKRHLFGNKSPWHILHFFARIKQTSAIWEVSRRCCEIYGILYHTWLFGCTGLGTRRRKRRMSKLLYQNKYNL